MNTTPTVWLVGAGPGDPELLTLKAARLLAQAEIVMVDDLVNPEILQHCPQARLIRVGKRGGCRSTPQAFINRLMLRYGRQGKRLVRLKGGDPCTFGRAGEEAQWLRDRRMASDLFYLTFDVFWVAERCTRSQAARLRTHARHPTIPHESCKRIHNSMVNKRLRPLTLRVITFELVGANPTPHIEPGTGTQYRYREDLDEPAI